MEKRTIGFIIGIFVIVFFCYPEPGQQSPPAKITKIQIGSQIIEGTSQKCVIVTHGSVNYYFKIGERWVDYFMMSYYTSPSQVIGGVDVKITYSETSGVNPLRLALGIYMGSATNAVPIAPSGLFGGYITGLAIRKTNIFYDEVSFVIGGHDPTCCFKIQLGEKESNLLKEYWIKNIIQYQFKYTKDFVTVTTDGSHAITKILFIPLSN
jgi:hypothetical protein